jgi:uncharacterized protein YjbJ (UPF0337 family)
MPASGDRELSLWVARQTRRPVSPTKRSVRRSKVGAAVGSDKLRTEGTAQEVKGDAQKALGDVKDAIKEGSNKAAKVVNKNL